MISIDWTILVQFLNFFILLFLLNKILYRPLQAILAERKQNIDGGHQKARSLEGEIEEKMTRYEAQLSEAKAIANQERSKLKQTAAVEEGKILGEAQEKATARLQTIKSQVAAEAAQASKTLKSEAEGLAGEIANKVLGRNLA